LIPPELVLESSQLRQNFPVDALASKQMASGKSDMGQFAPCLPPDIRWIAGNADMRI
jgi:hypothetical protein